MGDQLGGEECVNHLIDVDFMASYIGGYFLEDKIFEGRSFYHWVMIESDYFAPIR